MSEAKISHPSNATPSHAERTDVPELRQLAEARAALDHARRHAKWRRKCKRLESAARAVREAAMAAHQAGVGWTEIGDVLGIQRASTATPDDRSESVGPAAALDLPADLERAEPWSATLALTPPRNGALVYESS